MFAFITGISGQDGSYLTELLLEKNYTIFEYLLTRNYISGQDIYNQEVYKQDIYGNSIFHYICINQYYTSVLNKTIFINNYNNNFSKTSLFSASFNINCSIKASFSFCFLSASCDHRCVYLLFIIYFLINNTDC